MPSLGKDQWHFLRPLKAGGCPKRIIVFDTETFCQEADQNPAHKELRFRIACMSVWVKIKVGYKCIRRHAVYSTQQFWQVIAFESSKRCTTWIIAHNLGFDLTTVHFWDELEHGRFDVTHSEVEVIDEYQTSGKTVIEDKGFMVLTDPPTIINGWIGDNHVVMVDWFNYFRQSLAEIGESLGIAKLPIPADDSLDCHWFEYCERDVKILERSVIETITTWEREVGAPWAFTGPSLAMNAIRRKYLNEKQVLVHRDYAALECERLAYYGGEVVNGYIGSIIDDGGPDNGDTYTGDAGYPERSGRVYCLDTNSLYPWVMSETYLPCRMSKEVSGATPFAICLGWPSLQYCAVVRICCDDRTYPVRVDQATLAPILPERYACDGSFSRNSGRVVHATGSYWTCLCGSELFEAADNGDIAEIGRCWQYHCEPFLEDFANEFYRRRVEQMAKGDKAGSIFYKLLLNSSHGKWGQTSGGWVDYELDCPAKLWGQWIEVGAYTGQVYTYRSLGGRVQRQQARGEHRNSMPIISAAIASAGRARMQGVRRKLGGNGFYYQDTDSIHCNEECYRVLADSGEIDPTRLGSLRLVKIGQYAVYIGQKCYKIGSEWTHPGIGKKAKEIEPGVFQFTKFDGIASTIQSNPPGNVLVRDVRQVMRSAVVSGQVLSNGNVIPHAVYDSRQCSS